MTRFVLLFFCCAVLAGGCLTSAAASEYRDDVQSGRIVFATGFETAAVLFDRAFRAQREPLPESGTPQSESLHAERVPRFRRSGEKLSP